MLAMLRIKRAVDGDIRNTRFKDCAGHTALKLKRYHLSINIIIYHQLLVVLGLFAAKFTAARNLNKPSDFWHGPLVLRKYAKQCEQPCRVFPYIPCARFWLCCPYCLQGLFSPCPPGNKAPARIKEQGGIKVQRTWGTEWWALRGCMHKPRVQLQANTAIWRNATEDKGGRGSTYTSGRVGFCPTTCLSKLYVERSTPLSILHEIPLA